MTTGTLEEMHWEVLPHPAYSPDLMVSNFHLFSPIRYALGGKRFRTSEKIFVQYFFERGVMKVLDQWQWYMEVQGEYIGK
jgi:histone-lysine N-methyltransferase SETMAR